jgi:hypothetical protein
MVSPILFSKSAPKPADDGADDRRSARGRADGLAMPATARFAVIVAILAAVAGALYLILVRGDALLIDLAKLGRVFCF